MKSRRLVFAIVVGALAACAAPGDPAPLADLEAGNNVSGSVERLIDYAQQVSVLAPALLQKEYLAAEQRFGSEPGAPSRIRLAILLAARQAPFRNDARARELLRQAASDTGNNAAPYRGLAALLLMGLEERTMLERVLIDERRERQALRRKLDELKAIDEEIERRPTPPRVSPR